MHKDSRAASATARRRPGIFCNCLSSVPQHPPPATESHSCRQLTSPFDSPQLTCECIACVCVSLFQKRQVASIVQNLHMRWLSGALLALYLHLSISISISLSLFQTTLSFSLFPPPLAPSRSRCLDDGGLSWCLHVCVWRHRYSHVDDEAAKCGGHSCAIM
jgi:hypothetical protein